MCHCFLLFFIVFRSDFCTDRKIKSLIVFFGWLRFKLRMRYSITLMIRHCLINELHTHLYIYIYTSKPEVVLNPLLSLSFSHWPAFETPFAKKANQTTNQPPTHPALTHSLTTIRPALHPQCGSHTQLIHSFFMCKRGASAGRHSCSFILCACSAAFFCEAADAGLVLAVCLLPATDRRPPEVQTVRYFCSIFLLMVFFLSYFL